MTDNTKRAIQHDAEWKSHLASIRDSLPKGSTQSSAETVALLLLCETQHWTCFWCGGKMTNGNVNDPTYRTLEHVVPRSIKTGGANKKANLRAACRACNEERGLWPSTKKMSGRIKLLENLLEGAQNTIARNKVTMRGRCYYCKARFHVKTWWYEFKRKAVKL